MKLCWVLGQVSPGDSRRPGQRQRWRLLEACSGLSLWGRSGPRPLPPGPGLSLSWGCVRPGGPKLSRHHAILGPLPQWGCFYSYPHPGWSQYLVPKSLASGLSPGYLPD